MLTAHQNIYINTNWKIPREHSPRYWNSIVRRLTQVKFVLGSHASIVMRYLKRIQQNTHEYNF